MYSIILDFIYEHRRKHTTVHVYILPYWISCASEVSHKAPVFLWEVKLVQPIMSHIVQLEDCLVLAWWSLFVILCYEKPWEQLWSVANMTSLQDIIRTSWVNCNRNILSIVFIMLSHQIHVINSTPDVTMIKQQCFKMRRMGHNLDSKPPPTTCGVFLPHLAAVRHLSATLAGNQPSLGGPVVFRYFS